MECFVLVFTWHCLGTISLSTLVKRELLGTPETSNSSGQWSKPKTDTWNSVKLQIMCRWNLIMDLAFIGFLSSLSFLKNILLKEIYDLLQYILKSGKKENENHSYCGHLNKKTWLTFWSNSFKLFFYARILKTKIESNKTHWVSASYFLLNTVI